MPFKNCAQERAMFANAPDVARKWVKKYGSKCKAKGMKKRGLKR